MRFEKVIPGVLPPEKEIHGVDFLAILNSFDPHALSEEQLNAFVSDRDMLNKRCFGEHPAIPVEERIERNEDYLKGISLDLSLKLSYNQKYSKLKNAIKAKVLLLADRQCLENMTQEDVRQEKKLRRDWEITKRLSAFDFKK